MFTQSLFRQAADACFNKRIFRGLNLMEHAGMKLLRESGLKVPQFVVAHNMEEVARGYDLIVKNSTNSDVVIKAQVLTGGRGKGKWETGLQGGVKIALDKPEALELAGHMLGKRLFTAQTGGVGQLCNALMLVERKYIVYERYLAIVLDTESASPILLGCAEGGVNIEEFVKEFPDKLIKLPVDISKGLHADQAFNFAKQLRIPNDAGIAEAAEQINALYRLFIKRDCTFLEINPLAVDVSGSVLCVDCKIQIDDNARERQKDLFAKRDRSLEDTRDTRAESIGINYIALDGNIGCLVNGAGLAMSTMDIIKLHGGSPANFLDVGGSADANQIAEAFRLILSDAKVQVIFVNIFGGILKCDVIAQGIVSALSEIKTQVPIVIRLQGTNVTEAKRILATCGKRLLSVMDLDKAALMAVKLSNIVQLAKDASVVVQFSELS
ncbi:beta' subunit [Clonorchis sinensis]|uniref:Succinate--CoA ligase [ADP-forming] subunit beta, mitochondrial n=2 Tax=Clonorchis sinensis TaxID=79923 RepID=A0A8T1LYX6_CLOSI|nr:beta' subunit [Clonorchis sinensis]